MKFRWLLKAFIRQRQRRSWQKKYDVPMPIVEEVNKVLFEGKSPAEAVDDLMLRESRSEHRALQWEK